jgi:hypothetical protein
MRRWWRSGTARKAPDPSLAPAAVHPLTPAASPFFLLRSPGRKKEDGTGGDTNSSWEKDSNSGNQDGRIRDRRSEIKFLRLLPYTTHSFGTCLLLFSHFGGTTIRKTGKEKEKQRSSLFRFCHGNMSRIFRSIFLFFIRRFRSNLLR